MNTLHILNGDSSLFQMDQTNIHGDRLVWREILCEGEVTEVVGSKAFWEIRWRFLKSFSPEPDKIEENQEKANKLIFDAFKNDVENTDLKNYDEIVLWFEYDLFCQVNLIAALSWLFQSGCIEATQISLICLGKHPNYHKLVGLGEITTKDFEGLYPDRKLLSMQNISWAYELWAMFCKGEYAQILQKVRKDNSSSMNSSPFEYLEAAMEKQILRAPDETGFNELEKRMLRLMENEKKSRHQIAGEMLNLDDGYGFGDTQYYVMYDRLNKLV